MKISKMKRLRYCFKDLTTYILPLGILYYGFIPVVIANLIFTLLLDFSFWQTTLWSYGGITAFVYTVFLIVNVFSTNSPYDKEHEEKVKEEERKQQKLQEKEQLLAKKEIQKAYKQKMKHVLHLKYYLEELQRHTGIEKDIIWKTKEINEACIMHLDTKQLETEDTHYLSVFIPSKLFQILETFNELEGSYREAEKENVMKVLENFQQQMQQKFTHGVQKNVQLELRKQMRVLEENQY